MNAFHRVISRPLLRMAALDALASVGYIYRAAPTGAVLDQMAGYMTEAWAHGATLTQVAAAAGIPTELERAA